MSIDQLIRDLIEEDKFKAKYTTRQRSIFCKNMYAKVSKFIEDAHEETLSRVKELEEELDEVKEELEVAKNDLEFYKEENQELNKNYKSVFRDLLAGLRLVYYLTYLYVMWMNYKDKLEISIKDINIKSVIPYRNA